MAWVHNVPVVLVAAAAVLIAASRLQLQQFPRTSYHNQTYIEDSKQKDQCRYRVLKRAALTADGSSVTEVLVRPDALESAFYKDKPGSPPLHIHRVSTEVFHVVDGTMSYKLSDKVGELAAGSSVSIEPGIPHTFWNAHKTNLLVHVTLIPPAGGGAAPADSERFFETFAALGAEYGTISAVNPLQLLLSMKAGGVEPRFMPAPVWWFAEHVLCPFAEVLGFQPIYEEYTSKEEYTRNSASPASADT